MIGLGGRAVADIFISYKREERDRCLAIYERLTVLKFNVWFDARLESGTRFRAEIDRELRAAKAVLVLWSPLSCQSDWVTEEADFGRANGNLISVRIAECKPPMGFGQAHHVDMFEGSPDDAAWLNILASLGRLTGRTGVVEFVTLQRTGTPERWSNWLKTFHDDPLAGDVVTALLQGQGPEMQAELARARATVIKLEAQVEAYKEADIAQQQALRAASLEAARLQIELDRLRAARAATQAVPPPPEVSHPTSPAQVPTSVSNRWLGAASGQWMLMGFVVVVLAMLVVALIQWSTAPSYEKLAPAADASAPAAADSAAAAPSEKVTAQAISPPPATPHIVVYGGDAPASTAPAKK